ncbi:helix-turn-helix transcriptional regulator [Mycolicibacterium moriokaense]|nr:helix-turn-helix transcriptional regulator [Mycolicibacterium moriokaense]
MSRCAEDLHVEASTGTICIVTTAARPAHLVGRQREQRILATLLDDARTGRSGTLVVRGEAGIGKSALLADIAATATDFRVLQISGTEAEIELAYAALQQLCAPLAGLTDRLPPPQAKALRVALGLVEGPRPDRILVYLALLTLLAEASAERPTLCIIDDAQWVDTGSLQALVFAARRIAAERLSIIFGVRDRDGDRELSVLPELVLSGLDAESARSLLATILPGRLDERIRENLLAEANGNPLALSELREAVIAGELAGGYGFVTAASAVTKIEHSFAQRIRQLPSDTMSLLLIAAAESTGRRHWLWSAAAHLGISPDAAAAAEDTGLITNTDGIHFRHPLARIAVYHLATPAQRRRAHKALAVTIDGSPDGDDHRAWHGAKAAIAPDDRIALDLVQSAQRARGRGGTDAAAAFLALAAELSPQPNDRAVRALDAAETKLDAGRPQAAIAMVDKAEACSADELVCARAELVRAKIAFAASRGADAPALLLSAAERLTGLDPALCRETYLQALTAAILVGRCASDASKTATAIAKEASKAPKIIRPRAVDLLLEGLTVRFTVGHRAAAPKLGMALAAYVNEVNQGTADPRWHDITHRVCLDVSDLDSYLSLARHQLDHLRSANALSVLPLALQTSAGIAVSCGDLSRAAMLLNESDAITAATSAPMPRCVWAYLAAYRGEEQHCQEIVDATVKLATERGEGFDINGAHYANSILRNGLGQFRQALDAASSARQYDDIGMHTHVLTELIEAAVRCGEHGVADEAVRSLVDEADVCDTDTARGLAARARALVAEGPAAERAYQEAIVHLRRSPFAIYLPRTHLVYGEWLRRQKRKADGRTQLRIAHDAFSQIGAEGFARRTRRELKSIGEPVLVGRTGTTAELTKQEEQIAALARAGLSNVEIAGQLFLSPRTVEWHLRKIFAKLGIKSRRELRGTAIATG